MGELQNRLDAARAGTKAAVAETAKKKAQLMADRKWITKKLFDIKEAVRLATTANTRAVDSVKVQKKEMIAVKAAAANNIKAAVDQGAKQQTDIKAAAAEQKAAPK